MDARPGQPIEGYHLNELCVPTDAPGATEWSKMVYDLSGDTRTVQNEILGNSFSDNVHPISRKSLMAICNPARVLVRDKKDITPQMIRYAFAGLDWAMEMAERKSVKQLKSFTMLTISSWNTATNKMEINFIKRYAERLYDKPEEVIKDIIYWLKAFNVRIIGMDYGVGHKENQRIADIYGYDRCMEIEYVGEADDIVVWHELTNKFCVGRSPIYDDTLDDFLEKGFYSMPRYEGETSEYEQDLTTIYRYSDPHSRKSRFGKTHPDDFWQNLVYIRLAYLAWAEKLHCVRAD
ncbi:MAG: hypothetical protein Q8M92_04585 [Candidatus Subteraquimicrobiales bacterium]|nr:hypothetical protein [Candidatus Subteraquimicrobiales bacterium]